MTVVPNITTPMEGEEFNITEGSNRSITCTATGYPVPTVVWQNSDGSSLSNNRLVSGSPVNISSTGVGNASSVSVELMVMGAMRVDSGMYRCSVNNSVISTTRNITITVQCKLQVVLCNSCINFIIFITLVAPEIIIPPINTVVINGSEAILNCTIVGNPLPSISWSVSGVDISLLLSNGLLIPFDQEGRINDMEVDNTNLNTTTTQSSLRLPEIATFISGDYTCRASNILGNISRNATLTVYGMYIA